MVSGYHCKCHCGYEWDTRTDKLPKCCPRCKSYRWNLEKVTISTEVLAESGVSSTAGLEPKSFSG